MEYGCRTEKRLAESNSKFQIQLALAVPQISMKWIVADKKAEWMNAQNTMQFPLSYHSTVKEVSILSLLFISFYLSWCVIARTHELLVGTGDQVESRNAHAAGLAFGMVYVELYRISPDHIYVKYLLQKSQRR